MDTKLKKFGRSKITKAVAFFLALVFFTAFALSSLRLCFFFSENGEESSVLESYLSAGTYSPINGNSFQKALSDFFETAVNSKLIFKNGSKENYDSYRTLFSKTNKESLKTEKRRLLDSLLRFNGGYDFSGVFAALSEKKITLKKLASHSCYLDEGVRLYYNSSSENYVTDKNGETFESYEDYFYYNYGLWDDDEDAEDVTTSLQGTTVTTFSPFSASRIGTSSRQIPQQVKEKASNPNSVIELCSCVFNLENNYDGYYEITVDESRLSPSGAEAGFFTESFKTEKLFAERAKSLSAHFDLFSHASVAIIDAETGKPVFSNLEILNLENGFSLEQAKQVLSAAFPLSFVFSSESGFLFQNFPSKTAQIPGSISNACTVLKEYSAIAEKNYYFVVGIDSFFTSQPNDLSEPFEAALKDSNSAQKTVNSILAEALVFFLFFLALCVFLVLVAGRRPGSDEVHMLPTDKIFTLLRAGINLGAIFGIFLLAFSHVSNSYDNVNINSLSYVVPGLCAFVGCAFFLDFLLFVARHIKNKSLFKNLFVPFLVGKISKRLKAKKEAEPAYRDILSDVFKKLSLFVLLPNLVVGIPCVFSYGADNFGALIFGLVLALYDVCALCYVGYYAFCVRKVFFALEEMRRGNTGAKIDTSRFPAAVKSAADNAMHLGEGLSVAVENAVREEKMKAELITNVSHDLKTPLTSIINYSDLLSRCDITDETAKSYIEVLNEKSVRLKKLIEDLVEASKASSGAINVEMIKVSLTELALQLEGEYADEFEARGLELVTEGTENELFVLADGKLCRRVFDNLMCNVKKYAMPNTRVYMTLAKENDGTASITLKNISEQRLNISPEELKARFVRGDSSRTGEGNGLGLSIADNLCTLQGGRLEIEIIGDLFKATVFLRRVSDEG